MLLLVYLWINNAPHVQCATHSLRFHLGYVNTLLQTITPLFPAMLQMMVRHVTLGRIPYIKETAHSL